VLTESKRWEVSEKKGSRERDFHGREGEACGVGELYDPVQLLAI